MGVFMIVAKCMSRTSNVGLSGWESVSPCEVMLQVAKNDATHFLMQ